MVSQSQFRRPVRLPGQSCVLFVRTDRLGETLLNLPTLHALRCAHPTVRLLLMVHATIQDLFVGHPDIDEVLAEPAAPGSWWRGAWQLSRVWRARHVDAILISNPKKAYHLAAWLAGIPIRVGYGRKHGWALTHRIQDEKAVGERHEVEYNLQLLSALGITTPNPPSLELPIDHHAHQRIAQLFERVGVRPQHRLVAIHPWTSNPRKQWPVERMRLLISCVSALPGAQLVVIGGQEEQGRVSEVLEEGAVALNLVGRLSLKELAACLRRVRVLVTNDSGPMHVAAAVGTPVVALFGTEDPGSHPRRWGPWGRGHTVIHKSLHEITVDEVVSALQRYL